jgi:regulator of sirC expression with transglutaminase-like and TPR domain
MELDSALNRLAHDGNAQLDVAEVALLLARDEHADLDVDAYLSELNGMAREAKRFLTGSLPNRVEGLCRYLFHDMGFQGNVQDYYDPRNSYLNQVLDRRTGIPISLSAVAMAVGQRVGLRIEGVGVPGHFIVKAVNQREQVFFDPFNGGRRLTVDESGALVVPPNGGGSPTVATELDALPLRAMVMRMLANLKAIYLRDTDYRRAYRVIARQCQLNPHDLTIRRDLGIALALAGRPGKAIDHLSAYLTAKPEADDTEHVQNVLNQALKTLGDWN